MSEVCCLSLILAARLTMQKKLQWLEMHNEPGREAPSGHCNICRRSDTPVDVGSPDGRKFHFACLPRRRTTLPDTVDTVFIRYNERYPAIKTTPGQLIRSGKPWGGFEGDFRTGDCPVCLEHSYFSAEDEQQVWTGCHCFHDSCLVQLMVRGRQARDYKCPLCRKDINDVFSFVTGEWSPAYEWTENMAEVRSVRAPVLQPNIADEV
jgi:hypothetical protein